MPALRILELRDFGAEVSAADPLVPEHRWPAGARRVEWTAAEIDEADLDIIVTDHDELDLGLLEDATTPVLDTRNRVKGARAHVL